MSDTSGVSCLVKYWVRVETSTGVEEGWLHEEGRVGITILRQAPEGSTEGEWGVFIPWRDVGRIHEGEAPDDEKANHAS